MKKLFITTVLLSLLVAWGIETRAGSEDSGIVCHSNSICLSGDAILILSPEAIKVLGCEKACMGDGTIVEYQCYYDCVKGLIEQSPKCFIEHSKTETRNDIYWEPVEKSGRMRYYYTIKKIPRSLDDTIEEIDGVDAAFCNLPRQLEVFKVPHARWSDIHPKIIEKLKEATR